VVVEYILGLKQLATRLRDYFMEKRFVQAHCAQHASSRIDFRPGYRQLVQIVYLAGYALFGALAIAPALLAPLLQLDWRAQLVLLGVSVPACVYLAWARLVEYGGPYRAARLVEVQLPREHRVVPA
jgi:hypothetical protein